MVGCSLPGRPWSGKELVDILNEEQSVPSFEGGGVKNFLCSWGSLLGMGGAALE